MKDLLRTLPFAIAACAALAATVGAQQGDLKAGDAAPDFTLQATDGKTYSLNKDLKGQWVVLAWFPKAFTAG